MRPKVVHCYNSPFEVECMRFTESEIQWAAKLRGAGLSWDPQPGHYVFDIDGKMKAGSPFQAGVYLIESPNAVAASVGGSDELEESFVWLPTWENCRAWLADRGMTGEDLVAALASGLADGLTDREALYRRMLDLLESPDEETAS
jgi:hypothetical protein